MVFNLFNQPRLVGLDLKPDGIRLIRARRYRRSYVIEHAGIIPLSESEYVGGRMVDWERVQALLAAYIQGHGMRGLAAAIGLPAQVVRMRRIPVLAGLPHAGIEAEIQLEMQRDFPGMADSLALDYCVLPERDSGRWDVFYAAARTEYVSQYTDCVLAAGLELKMIDVDLCALRRAIDFATAGQSEDRICAILQMAANGVSLVVFDGYDIVLQHTWDVLTVPTVTAAKKIIEQHLRLASHIKIKKLVVCAADIYLPSMLADAANWQFELIFPDPFKRMRLVAGVLIEQLLANDFMTACGLAMREVPAW